VPGDAQAGAELTVIDRRRNVVRRPCRQGALDAGAIVVRGNDDDRHRRVAVFLAQPDDERCGIERRHLCCGNDKVRPLLGADRYRRRGVGESLHVNRLA
jgi:hypothetical protein